MSEVLLGIALFTAIVMALILLVLAARAFISRQVEATVTVNGGQVLQALTGQKLLAVLHDNDILIPSACAGAGTCGLCQVTVTNGGGDPLPTEAAKLDRTELRAGVRLACQVTVRGDISVKVPEDMFGTESWACRVVSTTPLAPFIREIVLELPAGATPNLRAGGFVQVTAPTQEVRFADFIIPEEHEGVWEGKALRALISKNDTETIRAYSFANRPSDCEKIVLNVRLALPPPTAKGAPPGVVSSYLFGLNKGDIVNVSGPYGSFGATDTEREMVFIGGGVGMAPLRAIIFDQLERLKTKRKMSYWYGARSGIELFYEDEFDELQSKHDNFSWEISLSDPKPEDNWTGATGFIHDVAFENHLNTHPAPENCEYYLCGPPLMIKAVISMLEDIGVDRQSIFSDDFGG